MYDVVIIGKGPAGLSCGIYTSMANLSTLIIGKNSTLIKTNSIKNYFGFKNVISGKKLIDNGIKQAISTGSKIEDDLVIEINYLKEDNFNVKTLNGKEYSSKAIVLATGNDRRNINILNIDKFLGKGISYCVTCDGFFFKNKKVGVIGNTQYTINEANELLKYTNNISILTNGSKLNSDIRTNNIVKNEKIISFEGDNRIEYIRYDNNNEEKFDGIFVANDYPSTTEFVRKLGIIEENNIIKTDKQYMTNIKGIFAIGDIVNNFKQISTAVGSGAECAQYIIKYCKQK